MPLEINDEERRLLSPEDLVDLQRAIDNFEAQAHIPTEPNGMRRDKTDFPLGIYNDIDEDKEAGLSWFFGVECINQYD